MRDSSAFSGSFTAADATAVVTGAGIDTWDVIELIGSLVAKSMLTTDETSDGTTRYRQLETLRQYARERLDDLGDPDVWRRRHAEHYAEFAEQAGAELVGPEELAWRARLMRELDNLRAAVGWSLDAESPDDRGPAIRVVVALSNEANSGTAFEVSTWAERELPLAEDLSVEQRAAVLNAAAWNALLTGDLHAAVERAEAVVRERVPGVVDAIAHVQLAYLASMRYDYETVIATLTEGLTFADANPDALYAEFARATLLVGIAGMKLTGGYDPVATTVDAAEALRAAEATRNPTAIANALFVRGLAAWQTDPDAAAPLLDDGIALVHAGTNSIVYPMMLAIRSLVYARSGDSFGAHAALHEAIVCAHDKGDLPALMTALDYGVQVWARFGEPQVAATVGGAVAGPYAAFDSLPTYEVPRREQTLRDVQSELGDDEFTAASERGAAMSVDEIVGYALADGRLS